MEEPVVTLKPNPPKGLIAQVLATLAAIVVIAVCSAAMLVASLVFVPWVPLPQHSTTELTVTAERRAPLVPQNLLRGSTGAEGVSSEGITQLDINAPPPARRMVKPYSEIAKRIEALGSDVAAVSPFIQLHGLARNDTAFAAIRLEGVDAASELKLGRFNNRLVWGKISALNSEAIGIVVRRSIADSLQLLMFDTLHFVTPSGNIQSLRIVGMFTGDDGECDGLINIPLAQSIKGFLRSAASGLHIRLANEEEGMSMREQIARVAGYKTVGSGEGETEIVSVHETDIFPACAAILLSLTAIAFTAILSQRNLLAGALLRTRRILIWTTLAGATAGIATAIGVLMSRAGKSLPLTASMETVSPWVLVAACVIVLLIVIAVSLGSAGITGTEFPVRRDRKFRVMFSSIALLAGLAALVIGVRNSGRVWETLGNFRSGEHRLEIDGREVPGSGNDVVAVSENGEDAAVELNRRVHAQSHPHLRNSAAVIRAARRLLGDKITATSPWYSTTALAVLGTSEAVVPIKGLYPARDNRFTHFAEYLTSGSLARLESERYGLALGKVAMRNLGARLGDRVWLVTPNGERFNTQVAALFDSPRSNDNTLALVNLRLAQSMEHAQPNEANGIALLLEPGTDKMQAAKDIQRVSGYVTVSSEPAVANRESGMLWAGIALMGFLVAGLGITTMLTSGQVEMLN